MNSLLHAFFHHNQSGLLLYLAEEASISEKFSRFKYLSSQLF